MSRILFTSDLHFGHENVLRFDERPFASVEEMDTELIRRWNDKVGKGDLVYVLGDMIWKTRSNDAPSLIKSLNGQIILIKGNHDRFLHNSKAKAALAGVKDYDDICVTLENGEKRRCILSHYFIPMYIGHRYNAVHLHGHSHNSEEATLEYIIAAYLKSKGYKNLIFNVGCMHWGYEPVTLDEILARDSATPPVDISIIAQQFTEITQKAYVFYENLVTDILSNDTITETSLESVLDGLLDFCGEDRFLALYKNLCKKFYPLHPELIAQHINLYREQYDPPKEE